MSGTDPVDIVRSFFESLGPASDQAWSGLEAYFDADTVWENVGLGTTVGLEDAIAFIKSFPVAFSYMQIDVLHICADGDVVLNERIDHFVNASGETVATIRVSGIIQVRDGKIALRRDYFDTAALLAGG